MTIEGNFIGTNQAGTAAVFNASAGISVQTDDTTVGGST